MDDFGVVRFQETSILATKLGDECVMLIHLPAAWNILGMVFPWFSRFPGPFPK
jgi:hypothetical protein